MKDSENHPGLSNSMNSITVQPRAELFKAGLRWPRVSARFEFRFESSKSISVLIFFVYKLMIGSSKTRRENYPRKFFWTKEKETRVKFNPRLSVDRPSNNWAQLKLAFELVHFRSWHLQDQNEPPCTALYPVPQKKALYRFFYYFKNLKSPSESSYSGTSI